MGAETGKGDLISKRFSLWLKSPKNVLNNCPEHYPPIREDVHDSDLAPFFWRFEPK
jgi:hypothetical protein